MLVCTPPPPTIVEVTLMRPIHGTPAGHVIRQLFRSLRPTKASPQMHTHMVTFRMCIRVYVAVNIHVYACTSVCV